MKNTFCPIVILFLFHNVLFAQQESHYTQFMHNKLMYNPAFAGAREVSSVMALYRGQWLGFQGAPISQQAGFDMPLGKNRIGLGGTLSHQKTGVLRNTAVNLSYSYSLVRTELLNIKFGLGGTARQYNYDFSDPSLVIKDSNDPGLLTSTQSTFWKGNIGGGLYFTIKDFYIGASIPNLYQNSLGTTNNKAAQQRHLYANIGGVFPMNNTVDFRPAVMVRYVKNSPMDIDANLSFMFYKRLTAGVSYRIDEQVNGESLDFLAFLQITDKLGVGAAYDYSMSKIGSYQKGSVEVLLRYDFNTKNQGGKKENDLTNPRYFF